MDGSSHTISVASVSFPTADGCNCSFQRWAVALSALHTFLDDARSSLRSGSAEARGGSACAVQACAEPIFLNRWDRS